MAFERDCIFHILHKKSKIIITTGISYLLLYNKLPPKFVALNSTHYLIDSLI